MSLPIAVPTRQVGSLGPIKRDVHPPPNASLYLGAAEINIAFDLIIRLINEVNALGLAGATGSLQAAYNNSGAGPIVIQEDAVRKQVVFADTMAGLGGALLAVRNYVGSVLYGLSATGYIVPDLDTGIQSVAGGAIQFFARKASPDPSYVFRSSSPYSTSSDIYLSMLEAGNLYFTMTGDRSLTFFVPGMVPEVVWSLKNEPGALRLYCDDTAGKDFLPRSDGKGTLGDAADRWGGAFASFYAGRRQVVAWADHLAVDCTLGNVVEVPLTNPITDITFAGAQDGMIVTLVLKQNASATGYIVGPMPSGYQLLDNKHLAVTTIANAVDVSVWQYVNTSTVKWVEIARSRRNPGEQRVKETTLGGGTINLVPALSAKVQVFEGTLAAPQTIDLSTAFPWVKEGDCFELIFSDGTGLATTATNKLDITTDNGATLLKRFDLVATLHGKIFAYYTGSAWKLSVGNSVLYL